MESIIFQFVQFLPYQSSNPIDSDNYAKNFDNLLIAAKTKLTADGTVYWTGYAQYFGAEDKQCDSVT